MPGNGKVRGPNKRMGETGTNRPGSQMRPFEGEVVETYLRTLRETGIVIRAREAANISAVALKWRRESDPAFVQAEADAQASHNATVETAVYRRAIDGWEEPIYWNGVVCGTIRRFSDRMLELYAKRRMKEYNPRVEVDQNVSGGLALGMADLGKLSPEGRKRLRELLELEGKTQVTTDEPKP